MFENDISELVSSFEQWVDFENRLQKSYDEIDSSEDTQNDDFVSEIKQIYASITRTIKNTEKVIFTETS